MLCLGAAIAAVLVSFCGPANAQTAPDLAAILEQLQVQQQQIEIQRRQIEDLNRTVRDLSHQLGQPAAAGSPAAPAAGLVPAPAADPGLVPASPDASAVASTTATTGEGGEHDEDKKGGEILAALRKRLSVNSYATAYYANYDWQTDPQRRDAVDLERVTLEAEFAATDTIEIEVEAEFEHLGTGSTMEFDRFEEFGEFETEIERGGEVELETVKIEWEPYEWIGVRAGYFPIGVGLVGARHRPLQYFGTTRFESEVALLPDVWSEAGIGLFGSVQAWRLGEVSYRVEAITGLDSTGFSSGNWVKGGHQTRFEQINAENLATALRVDWEPLEKVLVGSSFYYGKTANNRPKPDLTVDAPVTIWDVHGEIRRGPFEIRGLYLSGHLDDAAKVSQANARLSNNLNVKRTPVGAEAFAAFIEAGIHIDELWRRLPRGVIPFYRYDLYSTMDDVQAPVIRNPFFDRETHSFGLNYRPYNWLVLKGQYSMRERGTTDKNNENTLSIGLGYDLDF